jgi:hypothetical protein
VRDDTGFAGAGAGEQKHGAIDRENSLALLRIHVVEKAGHLSILDARVVGRLEREFWLNEGTLDAARDEKFHGDTTETRTNLFASFILA